MGVAAAGKARAVVTDCESEDLYDLGKVSPPVFALGEPAGADEGRAYGFALLVPIATKKRADAKATLQKGACAYIMERRGLDRGWLARARVSVAFHCRDSTTHKRRHPEVMACPATVVCGPRSEGAARLSVPPATDKATYGACVASPLHGSVNWAWVLLWIRFHSLHGLSVLFAYTMLPEPPPAWFSRTVARVGVAVEWVDVRDTVGRPCAWYNAQQMFMHECNMRAMDAGVDWMLHADFDEFLNIPGAEPPFFPKVLQLAGNDSWGVTLGNVMYDVSRCTGDPPLPIGTDAKALAILDHFEERGVYCDKEGLDLHKCLKAVGRRKFIVHTQAVKSLDIHFPSLRVHFADSWHLDARRAAMRHYQGALTAPICGNGTAPR